MSSPLRFENLTRRFTAGFNGVEALRGVTFEVPEGALFALAGANGAGKSTLIRTLLNIYPPTSGRAEVLGADSRSLDAERKARIGYVSEEQQMPGWMTAGGFLSYCKAFYPTWNDADLAELLRLYQLPLNRRLNSLSCGMRVKAALASSLAYRPKLIVLDEPFGGLDVLVREQLIESILDRTPEATVLLASHDFSEMESCATHIGYLNDGRLEFVDELHTLSDRFREVELAFTERAIEPANWPAGWLNVEFSPLFIRFTDSRYEKERTQTEIRRIFPEVREVTVSAMPLRSIVLALAKGGPKQCN